MSRDNGRSFTSMTGQGGPFRHFREKSFRKENRELSFLQFSKNGAAAAPPRHASKRGEGAASPLADPPLNHPSPPQSSSARRRPGISRGPPAFCLTRHPCATPCST